MILFCVGQLASLAPGHLTQVARPVFQLSMLCKNYPKFGGIGQYSFCCVQRFCESGTGQGKQRWLLYSLPYLGLNRKDSKAGASQRLGLESPTCSSSHVPGICAGRTKILGLPWEASPCGWALSLHSSLKIIRQWRGLTVSVPGNQVKVVWPFLASPRKPNSVSSAALLATSESKPTQIGGQGQTHFSMGRTSREMLYHLWKIEPACY